VAPTGARRRPQPAALGSGGPPRRTAHPGYPRVTCRPTGRLQGVRASPALRPASAGGPDHDPLPRLRGGVALNVPRHRSLRESMAPGPTSWLARSPKCSRAMPARRNCPAPTRWQRSGSITRRSRTVHAVGGLFIRRSPPLDATEESPGGERQDTERRHGGLTRCSSHHQFGGEPDAARRDPTPFDSLKNLRPTTTARQLGGRTPGQGRSPSRASSPTSHGRPTPSSARIRFTDHPSATWRARR
jgi:hypothetical protein